MQVAERRVGQSWRIHITSKPRNFNFKFRFKFNSTPTCTQISSFRLSILLKLRKFILRINSNPIFSPKNINGRGFFKARVINIVRKFRALLPKNRSKIAAKPESQYPLYPKVQPMKLHETIQIGLWIVGFLASVAQSVLKNGPKGVMMVASLLFKKFNTVKLIVKLATLPLLVAAITCYMFLFKLDDNNYWDYIAWPIGHGLHY